VNKGAVRAEDSIGMEEKRELVCPAAMVASISKKKKKKGLKNLRDRETLYHKKKYRIGLVFIYIYI
jgi:hypothetical protein